MELQLLSLIEKVLKQTGTVYKNSQVGFHCPKCNLEDYKKKLIINLDKSSNVFGYWHCWNCGISNSMRGRNIFSLFYKLNAPYEYRHKLKELLNISTIRNNIFNNDSVITSNIKLPDEFVSLTNYNIKSPDYRNAISYLKKRKLSYQDVIKYNIGYCETGKYANRIIIPSYDSMGNLNYFVAASFYNKKLKYLNPKINKDNIIMFELFINWNLPIILVEGVFDAISTKRNVIPLLGKYVNSALRLKILQMRPKEIVLALDSDAIKTSLKYIEEFIANDINVKLLEFPEGEDPNSYGFKNIINLYNNSNNITFKDLLLFKLQYR